MKLLLTAAGISNPSIGNALVELLVELVVSAVDVDIAKSGDEDEEETTVPVKPADVADDDNDEEA